MLNIQQVMRIVRDLQERVQKLESGSEKSVAEPEPTVRRGRPPKVVPPEPVTEI